MSPSTEQFCRILDESQQLFSFSTTHAPHTHIITALLIFLSLHFYFLFNDGFIGEHPAAMQRGCANNTISASIFLYIIILSMVCQRLNHITHGYGIMPYDVIRWMRLFKPYERYAIEPEQLDAFLNIDQMERRSITYTEQHDAVHRVDATR